MTLTIELTPEEEARIRQEAADRGLEAPVYARLKLLVPDEGAEDDDLTEDEIAEINAGLRRGLADSDAGRVTPLAEWAERKRMKYGLAS